MESRRMALIALLGVILYLIYQAWETDYPKIPVVASTTATSADAPTAVPGAPSADVVATVDTPSKDGAAAASAQRIHVVTDLFVAELLTTGAELRHVELSAYPKEKKNPEQKLALLDDRDGRLFTLQSGLALLAGDKQLANSQTPFTTAQTEYALAEGSDTLEVPFEYVDANGYTLRKIYTFTRGSYQIQLKQTLINHTGAVLSASPYARWLRNTHTQEKQAPFIRTFSGLGVYQQKPGTSEYLFKKHKLDSLDKEPYTSKQTGGWLAMLQHYFVAVIVPPADEALTFTAKPAGNGNYYSLYQGATNPVANGAEQDYPLTLYIGPKAQDKLDTVAKGLELTEDYGILAPIAKPLFKVLSFFHTLTGNWGWSIILLTLLVKLLFYPLSAAQYRSMAKMKKFTPRIAELRERHADDRERLNKAMMDLYKKEGFNPLAGCWPMLVQMPVFFSLYWVLVESVELRQAPFMLWVNDLSAADPLYILPILYGASMWLQQRMSGQTATMDPTQAKVMNVMPIAFTGMFLFFPAGLVVYWFVSNVVGILQQKLITWQMTGKAVVAK
jgi:YidC/Oxa1 family membrane protein insertase